MTSATYFARRDQLRTLFRPHRGGSMEAHDIGCAAEPGPRDGSRRT